MKPTLAFAGIGAQEVVVLFISIAVCVGLFLLFRALFLWYWKVDRIVANQEAQIRLLKELIVVMKQGSDKSEVRQV